MKVILLVNFKYFNKKYFNGQKFKDDYKVLENHK